ncbi:MAG: uracil-DNA glycosylase, partial [Spirochaetia bacterium]
AGQFLDKWLNAVNLSRDKNVYITNIVKCRPPGTRDPNPAEIDACIPYLHRQIFLVKPSLIMSLGRIASQVLLGTDTGIGRLRGTVHDYRGIPLIPTYHPSAVLRNPELKRQVWEDLKLIRKTLDER